MIHDSEKPEPIGQILRRIREFRGMTLASVSKLSQKFFQNSESRIPNDSLRKIEAGLQQRPSTQRIRALAQIYQITPEDLLVERAGLHPNHLAARFARYPDLRPPFDLDVASGLALKCSMRADSVRSFLPPCVELLHARRENIVKATIFVHQLREASAGKHTEFGIEVPVAWRGEIYQFILDYYCESLPILCTLRELYGYPGKLGHPEFVFDEQKKQDVARLTISGLPLITIEATTRERATYDRDSSLFPDFGRQRKRMLWKRILNPDGTSLAIDQLVTYLPIVIEAPFTLAAFRANLIVQSSVYNTLWGLRSPQQGEAFYFENYRVILPQGRVESDLLRDAK